MDEAIGLLDMFHITNEMMKEHLMDLCMNKKTAKEIFGLKDKQLKLIPSERSGSSVKFKVQVLLPPLSYVFEFCL